MKLNKLYKFVKNGALKTEILKYFSGVKIIEIMKNDQVTEDVFVRVFCNIDCVKNHCEYEYYISAKLSRKIEEEILTAFINDNYALFNWGDYFINVYGKDLAGFDRCFLITDGDED